MNFNGLYYTFPQASYLLFFILLFLLLFWRLYCHRLKIFAHYTSKDKLPYVLMAQPKLCLGLKVAAICGAWMFLCLALMQPKGHPHYSQEMIEHLQQTHDIKRMQPHEVVFLIDASASMSLLDGRLGESRLENAKNIADQVISRLQGQSASLYGFTSEVTKLSPPSMDYLFMRLMLHHLAINEGDVSGTDLKDMLRYLHEHYLASLTSSIKTIIIISDGGDNRLEELAGSARLNYIKELEASLGALQETRIYTIGVGTLKGLEISHLRDKSQRIISHLNEDVLKALSEKGEGRYYAGYAFPASAIAEDLAAQISKADIFSLKDARQALNVEEDLKYDSYYQFPLSLAILLLAFYLLWPDRAFSSSTSLRLNKFSAFLFISFFFLGKITASENLQESLQLGADYFSAKNYVEATNIYQKMLAEDLSAWEKSVVTYNLGTALAAQGKQEEAIEILQALSRNKTSAPLLRYRVLRNLALANFYQGERLRQVPQASSSPLPDSYFKALYFFECFLENIPLVQEAECQLLKLSGQDECQKGYPLGQAATLSKMARVDMREKARDNLMVQAAPSQSLPWLATGLQLLKQDLDFLLESHLTASLEDKYRDLFKRHVMSWLPLWDALNLQLQRDKNFFLLERAAKYFNQVAPLISKSHFTAAEANLGMAMEGLNHFMHLLFAQHPFQENIASLLSDFSLAALQDLLEFNTLLFLKQKLHRISLPSEHERLKAGMEAIENNLQASSDQLQLLQDLKAQLYFNESFQQLRRVLLILHADIHARPDLVLEAAIDEQRHALAQARLLARLQESQGETVHEAALFILPSQEYLLTFSSYFHQAAYSQQLAKFNAKASLAGREERCQFSPWNEVFPLFQQGNRLAKKIVDLVQTSLLDLPKLMKAQEKVLDIWQEALTKMKEPHKTGKCSMEPNLQTSSPQPFQSSFEEMARLIQQMNRQDQPLPSQPAFIKEGLKPW
ncbi:Uncharacterized protein NEOC65_002252 [Neochlamydia sp. AcF65]|nr:MULTISPECIES: VWA domain-containing protein [unclassified Neochlamydia]MBS4167146.1 Uncharacterized protein [Neochlamydia sp. AcF65]MBS4169458.1 Uncharacterized protein [Neochlamydia sp. AcF95]NGY95599.1 hypothetical protein [Neochlamydia sp. AcF84]